MVHCSLFFGIDCYFVVFIYYFCKCRPLAEVGCGVRLTAVQMPITRESQTWDFFGFRSSRCGKSTSRVLVTWPLSVVVWMTSMYNTVQNSVYSVDYGHLNSLDLARESKKTF